MLCLMRGRPPGRTPVCVRPGGLFVLGASTWRAIPPHHAGALRPLRKHASMQLQHAHPTPHQSLPPLACSRTLKQMAEVGSTVAQEKEVRG